MKIKNIQLLSLLLCTVTTQAWGKGEFETSGPISEPVTHNEPTLREQYLEQQRELRAARTAELAKENQTVTQTPVGKPKSGFIRNLLNKLKPTSSKPTNTVDDPSGQGADGLTPHEEEILKEIETAHTKLDEIPDNAQGKPTPEALNLKKTTIILDGLFKAELKKQNPKISDIEFKDFVKKLNADITSMSKLDFPTEDILKSIRETMNRLLADEKRSRTQATQKPNPTPTKAVSLPPFAKDTEEGINNLNKKIDGLRKNKLTQNETTALNTIIETLDKTINDIKDQKPSARDWLFRKNKKWSKLQEKEASDALRTAQEELANFNAARTVSKEIYTVADDILPSNYLKGKGPSNAAARDLLTAAKDKAKEQIEKGTFDASAKQKLLENLREELTDILNGKELKTRAQPVDQEAPTLTEAQTLESDGMALALFSKKAHNALEEKGYTSWNQTPKDIQELHTKFTTARNIVIEKNMNVISDPLESKDLETIKESEQELLDALSKAPTLAEVQEARTALESKAMKKVGNETVKSALNKKGYTSWEKAPKDMQELHDKLTVAREKVIEDIQDDAPELSNDVVAMEDTEQELLTALDKAPTFAETQKAAIERMKPKNVLSRLQTALDSKMKGLSLSSEERERFKQKLTDLFDLKLDQKAINLADDSVSEVTRTNILRDIVIEAEKTSRANKNVQLAIKDQEINAARESFLKKLLDSAPQKLSSDQKRAVTNFVNDYIKKDNDLSKKNLDSLKSEALIYIKTMVDNNTEVIKTLNFTYSPTGKEAAND